MKVPSDVALKVSIFSEAPSGASTGTSAAVAVALVGALDRLTQGHLTAHEVAYTAQAIETEMLKLQCGIQDQLCSAYGGINYIEMFDYPRATVSQIQIPNALWWELERRLVLIYFGKSHSSSAVHEKVIRELEGSGPDCRKLQDLRATAEKSRDAVHAGDFVALGKAMIENTEAQERLHPELVSRDARRVIEIAKEPRRPGLEGEWRGGRRWLSHHPHRHTLTCETGDDPRHRSRESSLQEYPRSISAATGFGLGRGRRKQRAVGRRQKAESSPPSRDSSGL